jgi:hypothetical protein
MARIRDKCLISPLDGPTIPLSGGSCTIMKSFGAVSHTCNCTHKEIAPLRLPVAVDTRVHVMVPRKSMTFKV